MLGRLIEFMGSERMGGVPFKPLSAGIWCRMSLTLAALVAWISCSETVTSSEPVGAMPRILVPVTTISLSSSLAAAFAAVWALCANTFVANKVQVAMALQQSSL